MIETRIIEERVAKLIKRNLCLKMQTRNLQRQIKSLEKYNKRLDQMLMAVSCNNCEGPQREAITYKEVLFRTLSRLADDGEVAGKADPKFLIPEVMAKAAELKAVMMKMSQFKCYYDK